MVTTQFTWPYGGHTVFLTGTFTRWTDHVLMTLMEGSSSIFLAFRNLDPGYHQYRFLVDGVWRVDDKQPCVTDETGVINNVVYVKEYEQQPSSSASSMEVDNVVFRNSAVSSGRMHGDLGLQISDGEIELFRRRFSMLLSGCTAYDLLPQSGKVSVLDITVAVKQAFHVMYEQGLIGAPLWDEARGQYRGMLTASDFILILAELHRNGSVLSNEELETHSISAWKEAKYRLNGGHDMPVNPPYERVLIQAGPSESLKDVALKLLRNKISTIPIIHQAQESSSPQLLHLVCLSGILKYICRYFRHSPGSLPLLQKPIGRLPIGTWVPEIGKAAKSQLTTLQATAPLSSALTLLMEAQVSSLPIVDGNGSLLDVYSRGDITSLAKDNAYARIPLDQTSMHQALQLRYEANGAIYSHRQCITCLRSESLHEVLERLSDPAVRRLIFVEPGSKRVEGIISISDIFHFIMG